MPLRGGLGTFRGARAGVLGLAVAAGLIQQLPASAQDLLPGLHAGVAYSDNITQTQNSDAIAGSWLEAGFAGHYLEQRPNLEAELTSDVAFRHYDIAQAHNEVVGGATGHVGISLIDNALKWVADDVYGQSSVNAFGVNSPVNRQGTNFFSTGPDLYLPLGERTRAYLKGRYALAYYQTLDLGNKRRTGEVGLERRVSALTTLRLGVSASRIEFNDSQINPPFDVRVASLGAHRETPRSVLDVEVGYTTLKDQGTSLGGTLIKVTASRQLSRASNISLTAGEEYSDSADFFALGLLTQGPTTLVGTAIAAADPLRAKYVYADWTDAGQRLTFGLSASWRSERRVTETDLDVDRIAFTAGVDYILSPRASLGIYDRLRDDRFTVVDQTALENSVGVRYIWRFGRRLSLRGTYERSHGNGTAAGIRYDENLVAITLNYSPLNSTPIVNPQIRR